VIESSIGSQSLPTRCSTLVIRYSRNGNWTLFASILTSSNVTSTNGFWSIDASMKNISSGVKNEMSELSANLLFRVSENCLPPAVPVTVQPTVAVPPLIRSISPSMFEIRWNAAMSGTSCVRLTFVTWANGAPAS